MFCEKTQVTGRKVVAILGFTPREEVLVEKLLLSTSSPEIHLFLYGTNIALEERVCFVHPVDFADINGTIVKPLLRLEPDITLIGPDKFSLEGVKEVLDAAGVPAIGSDSDQIMLEISKSFLRRKVPELRRYYPDYLLLDSYKEDAIRTFTERYPAHVVKYEGLFSEVGGGVRTSKLHLSTITDTLAYASRSIKDCGWVIIEQYVEGQDFSINAVSARDGSIFFLPENHCYKLRDDSECGPNTSGTGSYAVGSGLPFLPATARDVARQIVREMIEGVTQLFGRCFVSGLNVDFRLGNDGTVYLLEVNARFAGAATLSTILSLTRTDLVEILESAYSSFDGTRVEIEDVWSVSIFAYPEFFPSGDEDGALVTIPTSLSVPAGVHLYTGWVDVHRSDRTSRVVVLKNSTALLFETKNESPIHCRNVLYKELARLPAVLKYRNDIALNIPYPPVERHRC